MTEILQAFYFCHKHNATVRFQDVAGRRSKNSVVLTFAHSDGELETVGGNNLVHCVSKAETLISVKKSMQKNDARMVS